MKILNLISRIWEFISRLARVIVFLDDFLLDARNFWEWLTAEESIEPEKSDER